MKNLYLLITVILVLSMVLLPLCAVKGQENKTVIKSTVKADTKTDEFLLYDEATEKITEIPAEKYVVGVVAAEMPAAYKEEAIKAQAVAAYTYACCKREERKAGKCEYDVTANSATCQGYLLPDKYSEKWGENADKYIKKIKKAVKSVKGYLLTYKGKPILAAYHAVSAGKTESSQDVWGKEYPYLSAVDSVGDLLCPTYLSEAQIQSTDFCNALKEKVNFTGEPQSWIGEIKRTKSGRVQSTAVCGTAITGEEIQKAFSLKSANFDIAFSEGSFSFTVRGYGHGVGMSQYGANYMAMQEETFDKILKWYYKGAKLEKIN